MVENRKLEWLEHKSVYSLCYGKKIVDYIRWSIADKCWVNFKGESMGVILTVAKQKVEREWRERCKK